jgi:hypothetical protein
MSVGAKQNQVRRAALAGAIFAATALAAGVMPQPAAAQYAYDYGNQYQRHGGWDSDHRGWHRGWSKNGRGRGDWAHSYNRAGRSNEGFSGSSRGNAGGYRGSGSGGNGGAYNSWLGAHGSYR